MSMLNLTIQPYEFKCADTFATYYIEVPEGSELLTVTTDDLGVHTAWCIVDIDYPPTRRFFKILMPGESIAKRSDFVFIKEIYDGGMVWLVFEDYAMKLVWMMKEGQK